MPPSGRGYLEDRSIPAYVGSLPFASGKALSSKSGGFSKADSSVLDGGAQVLQPAQSDPRAPASYDAGSQLSGAELYGDGLASGRLA